MRALQTSPRGGGVAVEFALTAGVIVLILVGVIEWGWLLSREVAVIQTARDAAHVAALTPIPSEPATAAEQRALEALGVLGFDEARATVEVALEPDTDAGDVVRVRVTVPYDAMLGLVPTPANLSSETVMRLEMQ